MFTTPVPPHRLRSDEPPPAPPPQAVEGNGDEPPPGAVQASQAQCSGRKPVPPAIRREIVKRSSIEDRELEQTRHTCPDELARERAATFGVARLRYVLRDRKTSNALVTRSAAIAAAALASRPGSEHHELVRSPAP